MADQIHVHAFNGPYQGGNAVGLTFARGLGPTAEFRDILENSHAAALDLCPIFLIVLKGKKRHAVEARAVRPVQRNFNAVHPAAAAHALHTLE